MNRGSYIWGRHVLIICIRVRESSVAPNCSWNVLLWYSISSFVLTSSLHFPIVDCNLVTLLVFNPERKNGDRRAIHPKRRCPIIFHPRIIYDGRAFVYSPCRPPHPCWRQRRTVSLLFSPLHNQIYVYHLSSRSTRTSTFRCLRNRESIQIRLTQTRGLGSRFAVRERISQ